MKDFFTEYQELVKQYPEKAVPGIYSIMIQDKVVYIGKSINLLSRYCSHKKHIYNNPKVDKEAKEHKYRIFKQALDKGYQVRFEILTYCQEQELGESEAIFISQYRPVLNYQYPIVGNHRHWRVNKLAKTITLDQII